MAELIIIQESDATVAFESALNRRDLRFLGIAGFSVDVPGISDEQYETYVEKHGVRVLEGTRDSFADDELKKLMMGARLYAEQYNTLLLKHLQNLNKRAG